MNEQHETQKERFDDLYYEAFNEVKDRLIDHFFCTDNWTNEQIEEITGRTLYAAEGLEPEDIAEYASGDGEIDWKSFEEDTGRISLNTWDSEYLDDMLRESTDIDLDTMLQFAKSLGADLSGVEIPYKMIIFSGEVCNEDTASPDQIEAYLVCSNKEELVETWEKHLPQYEGWQYCIQSGDGGFNLSGTYDPNDREDIEAIPSYIMTYEYTCDITAYAELGERTLQNVAEDILPYDTAITDLWESLDCGCCSNVDAKEAHYGILKIIGTFSGTVQAYNKFGAIAKAEDAFYRADFGDLKEIEFKNLFVDREANPPERSKENRRSYDER